MAYAHAVAARIDALLQLRPVLARDHDVVAVDARIGIADRLGNLDAQDSFCFDRIYRINRIIFFGRITLNLVNLVNLV